ncbi:MAG: hypothetical protein GY711_33350 [bacterium]|nr:hypothetical protein [bacterium]
MKPPRYVMKPLQILAGVLALTLVSCSDSKSVSYSEGGGEHADGGGEGEGNDADSGEHHEGGEEGAGHDSDGGGDGDGDAGGHEGGANDADKDEHEGEGHDSEGGEHDETADGPLTGQAAIDAMRTDTTAFLAKAEHKEEKVKVQHLLVSFAGTPRSRATRSRGEAEQLTADLWAQIKTGKADFAGLISKHTDDSPPGIYLMTLTAPSQGRTSFNRYEMVPAFGNAGWRLQVGEFGIAPYDPQASPFGWHIVKRIE